MGTLGEILVQAEIPWILVPCHNTELAANLLNNSNKLVSVQSSTWHTQPGCALHHT